MPRKLSNSTRLGDFAVGLVDSVPYLLDGQLKFPLLQIEERDRVRVRV